MARILSLVLLVIFSTVAKAQAPSNYTNINGRYRWIAGMFDSTFHIPKGTTPSLRTGGSTNSGGLFYNTSDSSVYTYTGTQWIKLRGSINPLDTTNKYVTQVYKKNASDSVFYVRGGNHLWAFNDSSGAPGGGGGGKIYYFNGGVSMGTFGGFTMYELGDTANTGAAANFTRATTGNIANFITDPGKPGLLQIPAGVWTIDAYLSETGGGSNNAEIYVQVEKWDGSTITTIATSPIEQITNGSVIDLYTWAVSIPTTSLAVTDRIIIQFYIQNTNGKTVTLYTQNGYVGEVHTTFTTGIGALNGLTAPAQYLNTGTSGTDFNISSVTATHTFNLPTASATNRGALSSADWTTFNSKVGGSGTSGQVSYFNGTNSITSSPTFAFTPTSQLLLNNSVTAASAIARGMNVTSNLTAAANNDVLVGLDISPTFTNGAFTGVNRFGLRVLNSRINFGGTFAGSVGESLNPQYFLLINPSYTSVNNSATNIVRITPSVNLNNPGIQTAAALYIEPTYTNVGSANLYSIVATGNNLFGGAGAATSFSGSNVNFLGQAGASTNLNASAPNGQGFRIRVNSTAAQLNFEVDGSGNSDVRFVTANTEKLRIFNNGNVTIQNGGTHTDAGFKLDVNGTARVQGALTVVPANNTTGFSISGSSLTGSNAQSLVSLSQTWNTTGNPTAIKLDVTNTASGANSYLLDLQVGGIPQFTVFKGGEIKTSSPAGGVAQTWKLGSVHAVSPTSPDRTIEVEVNGTTYYLHAKTTNN